MDRQKTGRLIAAARKDKNMTQKELAERLHISDRTISKWERGAGFPDVSLLEPLAAALNLAPLDLLRGEKTEETNVHAAVSETLEAIQERRSQSRREFWKRTVKLCVAVLVFLVVIGGFGFLQLPVNRTETAYVYQNGQPVAVTEVRLEGRIIFRPQYWTYSGRFATSWAPGSTWEGLTVGLDYWPWDGTPLSCSTRLDTTKGYIRGEVALSDYYISPLLKDFVAKTETGDIIATRPEIYQAFVDAYGGPELEMVVFEEPNLKNDPRAQYTGGYPPRI